MAVEAEVAPPVHVSALDLTGNRISRTIIKLAWPVVIERLSISVLSGVDAALVGHYVGADGLAAVGIGGLMFWIALSGALAIDVGSTAVVARDVGAGDRSRAQIGLHTAIIAALAWGLICTTAVFLFAPTIMSVMGAKSDVAPLGVEYLRAGSLGFPMLMVLYAVSGSLRGMGNTWMPMVILLIVNLINAVVTLLLISGAVADLGVRASGIGYATAGRRRRTAGAGARRQRGGARSIECAADFPRVARVVRTAGAHRAAGRARGGAVHAGVPGVHAHHRAAGHRPARGALAGAALA